jgi:hypothetical protein
MTELDEELNTMSTIAKTLSGLPDNESRVRVLRWVTEKLGLGLSSAAILDQEEDTAQPSGNMQQGFDIFADLLDEVSPLNDVEKALTGAYWFQAIQNNPSWNSYQVNDILKDTGQGIGNVTRALDNAEARNPALVRQIEKSGKSKQARKTYKLTTSGIEFIVKRLKTDQKDGKSK